MNINKITKKHIVNALIIILIVFLILKFIKKEYFSIGGSVETENTTNSNPSFNNSSLLYTHGV
jgi:hypothetical protein